MSCCWFCHDAAQLSTYRVASGSCCVLSSCNSLHLTALKHSDGHFLVGTFYFNVYFNPGNNPGIFVFYSVALMMFH